MCTVCHDITQLYNRLPALNTRFYTSIAFISLD